MDDYKDKIRKLLALAESPNEHEAKEALLKARELMARHKLTEAEVRQAAEQQVKNIRLGVTFSKRREPWINDLSAVIAEYYCCQAYRARSYGMQTNEVGLIGLEDDVEVCEAVFRYALDCVRAETARIKARMTGFPAYFIKSKQEGYGYGFVCGVQEALMRQQEQHHDDWGLVLVMSKEVTEASSHLKNQKFDARDPDDIDTVSFSDGYIQGKQFDPQHKLGSGEEASPA